MAVFPVGDTDDLELGLFSVYIYILYYLFWIQIW
jgi:hypothetical protein